MTYGKSSPLRLAYQKKPWTGRNACPTATSNYGPVANHSILWHDDDAIANIVGTVLPVRFANPCFVEKPYSTSNTRVLVYYGAVNDGSLAYSKTRHTSLKLIAHFLNGLIIISSHDKRS